MTGSVIFAVMAVLSVLIFLGYYWTWFETHPTTEEIIKESLDKHGL